MEQDTVVEQLPLDIDTAAEEAPKPKTRRRRKKAEATKEGIAASAAEKTDPRTDKTTEAETVAAASGDVALAEGTAAPAEPAAKPARKPRTRKKATPVAENDTPGVSAAEENPGIAAAEAAPTAGAKKTAKAAPAASAEGASADGASANGRPAAGVAGEKSEGDAGEVAPRGKRRRRHVTRDQAGQGDQPQDSQQGGNQGNQQGNGQNPQQNGGQNNQQGGRRRNRHKNNQQQAAEPTLTREELEGMKVADLRAKAAELDIDTVGKRKPELIEEVYTAAAAAEGFRTVEGVIQMQPEGYAFLRTGHFAAGDNDAFVHQQLIRQYGLRPGDLVRGTTGPGRANNKFPPLQHIDLIEGKSPEEVKRRPRFRDLTPIYPNERLRMEAGKETVTGRAIDLVAPIGKGQRGLIVSPPKAGKTTVLKKICQSIAANNPEVHLFCLLVDERPEEVTDMERSIRGDVVASTFDMPASNHTAVAEMVIEHAKRLVELGEDVVVVLDSITRLARAYNLAQPASGRILSGGVDSAALYPPKKFLGAARNIENGGSLTILASALVDTGSKMDEVIFEEFKGTGNMELKLDRDLADRRIFPAIDPVASGTRNEDLLIDEQMQPFVWGIRRVLANMNNTERAATALVKGLKATNTNEEFLIRSARKAAQTEYVS